MVLPSVSHCCWVVPLRTGSLILIFVSTVMSVATIALCSWKLPHHKTRRNEDNLILMSMLMFSTLSTISNLGGLLGILMKRPSYVQLSQLSNSVFLLCIFVVTVATCLFSPGFKPLFDEPGTIALVVFLLLAGALYSVYYMTVMSSTYTRMKLVYGDSEIPV